MMKKAYHFLWLCCLISCEKYADNPAPVNREPIPAVIEKRFHAYDPSEWFGSVSLYYGDFIFAMQEFNWIDFHYRDRYYKQNYARLKDSSKVAIRHIFDSSIAYPEAILDQYNFVIQVRNDLISGTIDFRFPLRLLAK